MYIPEGIMFNADQSEPLPSLSDIIKAQGQEVDTIVHRGDSMFIAGTNRISVKMLSQPNQQRKGELTAACGGLIDGIKQARPPTCPSPTFTLLGSHY